MEKWIRNTFEIVNWGYNGENVESFQYQYKEKTMKTKLNYFLNNQSKYQELIDYWEQEGLNPPV